MMQLSDIVGQDLAVGQLARTLDGTRRPHAYMFCGPVGVGRRTTAESLAAVLLCRQREHMANDGRIAGLDPDAMIPRACGVCSSCRAFESGAHGDYHLVERELARHSSSQETRGRKLQDLPIQVIREFVIGPAGMTAAMGRGRVFVIREAELMSNAAQNSLLKTLEEPPPGVTLILLCRSDSQLLPTTRSRCSVVRFGSLPQSFVAERLAAADVEFGEARFWAAYTNGSLGESLRLAASDLYGFKRQLVDRLAAMTESVDVDLADALVTQADAMADATIAANKQLARTVAIRNAAGVLLGLLASVYRDAMRVACDCGGERIHEDQGEQIDRIAAALGEAAADIVDQMARYEQLLWRNVNAKILWDNVMITCATGAPLQV
jgi:DNA polymerase-3 subunit delta'